MAPFVPLLLFFFGRIGTPVVSQTGGATAREYAMPGALRAGFEYYRAFPADARQNQLFAQHKLTMPVLGIGGAGSLGPIVGEELRHVALDVQSVQIDGAGHWVAEEQPEAVTGALLKFLPAAR